MQTIALDLDDGLGLVFPRPMAVVPIIVNNNRYKLVYRCQLRCTVSYLTPRERILRVAWRLRDGDRMASCSQPLYYLLKSEARGRRLAMRDSDSLLPFYHFRNLYSISIHIACMLNTKGTFEWLIHHDDVSYALAYWLNTCQVSLVDCQLSLSRRLRYRERSFSLTGEYLMGPAPSRSFAI